MTNEESISTMTAKAAPPLTVIGATMAGFHISDWVQVATLIYVILMAGHKAWTWHREWRASKGDK